MGVGQASQMADCCVRGQLFMRLSEWHKAQNQREAIN